MRHEVTVLVTDDDSDVRFLAASLLFDAGYAVREAGTGKECLQTARSCHPDIILLDVLLPDMTGIEVCRKIKAEPGLRESFVILTSGTMVSSEYQAEGLNVGADGYIVKGLTNGEFLARIHSLVRIKKAEDALREKEQRQKKLIAKLRKALSEIRTLRGLIPICASCKKIRDDKGYWNQLEKYLIEHTEALFSHGICPECTEKLYPEYYKQKQKSVV